MIKTATKKPVTIEFIGWTGENFYDVHQFCKDDASMQETCESGVVLVIKTLEGDHMATVGDMIIKGVKGEFYPCKPDIFNLTYDIN